MKKKVFSLMMTLLLAFIGVAKAEIVEIGDGGTSTNSYLPTYEFYNYSLTQQLYTADEIGYAGTISSIAFYSNTSATRTLQVYMVHTTKTAFSGSTDWITPTAADMVFSGSVTWVAGGWTTLNLNTPFEYNGADNLCLIVDDNTGSYVSSVAKRVFTPGGTCAIRIYSDGTNYNALAPTSYSGTTMTLKNQLQLDITPAGGGAGDQLFAIQDGAVVETIMVGTRPNGAWMEPFTFQLRNDGPATTVTDLDWTPQTYFTLVSPELPFNMARNEEIDVQLATGDAEGNTSWQMVAIYGTGRTARVWDMVVDAYDPAIPDVWELAHDFGTVNAGFSYQGMPSQITPTVLHNDYTLPFPEIPEGVDGVYKFTVEQDMMINAYVDPNAQDGKVALYTEDFYGEGGPMADNNYTGFDLTGNGGGGAAAAPFEVQIGDGTSTTSYLPFYCFYNYSISQQLFLAAELQEAGVTRANMTSLSWYCTATNNNLQSNITIWMGNVEDTSIGGNSVQTAGMSKVYVGNMTPVANAWNEFVFNQGTFAWDGHSNILISVQRNNGAWASGVSWQAGAQNFTAGGYSYNDSGYGPYNMETTSYVFGSASSSYGGTTTSRANIIMKADGSRDRETLTYNFDDSSLQGWTAIDGGSPAGYGWHIGSTTLGTGYGHNGSADLVISQSYDNNYGVIYPDNYLISPQVALGGSISFYACGQDANYAAEHFGVAVSTTTNTSASAFTTLQEWTIGAKGARYNGPRGNRDQSAWTLYTVDLSAYAGQTGYVAIRHFNCSDMYFLDVDDITIVTGSGSGPNPPTPPTPPTPGTGGNGTAGSAYVSVAGPVVENLPLTPGTYYLVASATQADYDVFINVDSIPCPATEAEGFAFSPQPADDEDEVEPASVTLRWMVPDYATSWRLIFGTTYYPEPNHPQTIMTDWNESMVNSYTVTNLWNNTNYFWRVEFKNDGCPAGVSSPIWGFTTHLNVPQNLTAVDYTVFNDETITLNWTPVVDRTYRQYFIYRDGVKVGETTMNNINNSTYTDGPLAYNMGGYVYYVTAVYDEGESAPSNQVTVKVSGYGDVNGHVYEQDGETGIAGATVHMVGTDEFGDSHTYNYTTNGQGYYSGHPYAGEYNGSASCDGYQTINEPIQGNPVVINYNQTTTPIDYMLDENFDPVCSVIAQYYPDSLDPEAPYVKVYWGCGLPGEEIVEPFETGDFSLFDWQIDPTYPWSITTYQPYEGTYCMKSGGAGVANVVSNMTVTVDIPADGLMSFFGKISCESSWDYGYFYIDGVQKGSYTGAGNWGEKQFDITEGTHTFQWRYTKDGSVNSNDDCFYVDYITFYKRPEPAQPGTVYDFENSTMQGWTSLDADGDGYGWYVASEIMSTGYGHNGSNDCVLSQSYYGGLVLYPDNYLVSPQVPLGGVVTFYACAQDASYAAEHFGVAVSTTTNNNPSAFTMLQEWTMTAKSVGPVYNKVKADPTAEVRGMGYSRDGNTRVQGNWYQYTVDLSAYAGQTGYVAIRHFNCSDMFYLDVDDIFIGEPGKSAPESGRAFSHYRVYRTDCYNDGPYTLLDEDHPNGNTVVLACELHDTIYIDVDWPDVAPGVYKWGVGCVYSGNRGEEIQGPIHWAELVNGNRDLTYNFDDGSLQDWTTIDADGDGLTWVSSMNPGIYHNSGVNLEGTGNNGSAHYVISGSYANQTGQVLYPDNYLVSPQIALGGSITFYACAQDASYAAEHFGVAVSTTNNTSASAFTTIQEWTMTAKGGSTVRTVGRDGNIRQGNWYQYTVDLSSYSGMGYVAIRHFNCYDQFILNVDDITLVPGNGGGGGGGNNNNNTVQEPRESEIVWSNCLDKDMYLTDGVDITVLLNSADSPEGVTVSFENYNEAEQEMYPVDDVVLDETGFYAWETFRKGEYKVTVTLDGYETIVDSVSIWDPTHLRYVMIEIIYGVDNLYVSRTGWAMWDAQGLPSGGNGGGGGGGGTGTSAFTEGFEGGLNGWNVLTVLSDGGQWIHSSQNLGGYDYTTHAHGGTGFAMCYSFVDYVGAYNTDSYLITPQKYDITSGSTLTFWADNANDSYPENFSVCVSTAANPTSASDFTQVWSGGAKGGSNAKANNRHDGNRYDNWRSHSINLGAYAGQSVWIAFHDVNYDMYEIWIDDVELSAGGKNADNERHLEYFKVMCESIDHEPIFNTNTIHPFCQLATDELVEGEHYICKVAAMYSTGMSDWAEVEWEYEPCDHYTPIEGLEITTPNEGNHLVWEFNGGGGGGGGGQGGNGDTFTESWDNGLNGWTNIDNDGDGHMWYHSTEAGNHSTMAVDSHSGAGHVMGESYCNATWNALTPDDYLVSPQQYAIAAGSTISLWACTQDVSYPSEHFGFAISTGSNTNANDFTTIAEWTITAKGAGKSIIGRNSRNTREGNWYQFSADLSNYAGQNVWIAVRHFNCTDMFILNIDDIELTNGAKATSNPWDVMLTFEAPEGGHYGVAYDGNNFYTSNWGYSSAAHNFYKYDLQGNMLEGYEIAGCGTLRGITYDGTYFYGVANSSTVYCVDLANHNVVSTFTSSYGAMRGITYDPARDGFWVIGNWSGNLTLIDRTGAVQFTGPAPESASDLAYYIDENDVEHVFCFNNGTNDVVDYNITTNTLGGSVFNFNSVPGVTGTSGGCTVGSFNGKIAFIGDSQQSPNLIAVCELRDDNSGPVPPIVPVDGVLGFMIFRDGEWLAQVGPEAREYTDEEEFAQHEYCVRVIYDGTAVLPSNNFYYAMSCPVCEGEPGGAACLAGAPIHGEALGATDQVKIWWGEETPGPGCEGDEFSINFDNSQMPAGWTTHDEDGDGFNWVLGTACDGIYLNGGNLGGAGHNASADLIVSGSYSNVYGALTPDNWLISPALTLCEGSTFSFWACGQDASYVAEHFGVAVSEDGGNSFTMVQEWTMTAKGNGNMGIGRDGNVRAQGSWHQYTVDLGAYAGEGRKIAIRHFNCTDMFILDVDDLELTAGAKATRDGIVKYNVYRSTENANYALIGEVPAVAGQTYYEYIDTPASTGTYYYQVTAVYADCESEPATAFGSSNDYVVVGVTGVDENGGMAIFPNPTKGNVTIQANGMNHITVVSVLGQVVYDADVDTDEVVLNMSQYNSGMYTVRVITENGVRVERISVVR